MPRRASCIRADPLPRTPPVMPPPAWPARQPDSASRAQPSRRSSRIVKGVHKMKRAQDKVVVVLGASSEGGCGWRLAELFAREGAKVVVAARSAPGIKQLAASIGGAAFQADAGVESNISDLADFAAEL